MGTGTNSKKLGADFREVKSIAGVKTLMARDTSRPAKIPLVSFTSNRYLILEHNGEPKYLAFYENGHLTREIDLMDGPTVHAHNWVTEETAGKTVTRRKYKSSSKKHRAGLTEDERRLVYRIKGMLP